MQHNTDLITIRFTVQPCHDGWRLDRFIKARISRLSRTRIQKMIRSQEELGAAALRPSARVRAGQEVALLRPAPEEPDVPMYFDVLVEDAALMAICKPAGLPVHATARFHRNTLTALLRQRFQDKDEVPQLAHRLDRETSGVMLLGCTAEAGAALKASFRKRLVHKRYLAVVHGQPEQRWTVDLPLGQDVASGIRVKMGVTNDGQPALTRFSTLERRGDFSLVEALPETGRQHQIRAHLGACGYPIVGDKLYGEEPFLLEYLETGWTESLQQRLLLPRQALHAAAVSFPHPATGEETTVESPLTEDLQEFWMAQGASE